MSLFDQYERVRKAIQDALPDVDQRGGTPLPLPGFTYLPQSHALALDFDATIVVGMRGAGKSHWYSHLADPMTRSYLGAYKSLRISTATKIVRGFGTETGDFTPSTDTIKRITRIDPDAAWKATLGQALSLPSPFPDFGSWENRTEWVRDHPEEYETLLRDKDRILEQQKQSILVLFDALDRTGDDWKAIRRVVNRLFRLALEVRSFKYIRMKLFVRPDMLEDEILLTFPDSSKLLAGKQELTWKRVDLYAVFFQRLGNLPGFRKDFIKHISTKHGLTWLVSDDGKSNILPKELRTDEELQSRLFHEITGPTMAGGAAGHKRGIPYSWLVNHLMDSRGQVSPRSFFMALVTAAQTVTDSDWEYPLDPHSIQSGVAKASEIRMNEITEDYSWVSKLMKPLGDKKLSIPCFDGEIREIWDENNIIGRLARNIDEGGDKVKLPPRRIDDGFRGLIEDLADLGIMYRLLDNRIQIPDVYRIAYGLGRKGGVKPLK